MNTPKESQPGETLEPAQLAAERLDRIRQLLRGRHVMRGVDLARELGVSAVTMRRDLVDLQKQGLIRRVHGGAVLVEGAWEEPPFDDKADTAAAEKKRIADEALRRIGKGDAIYLDGGSTVLALARLLRERTDLTVVTNSLRAAMELSSQGPRLILVGGELRRRSQTMVGSLTLHLLEELHVDKAFMGTIGVTAADGLTTTEPDEAFTKQLAMRQAGEVYLLADRRKFDVCSLACSGAIGDVDVLITDRIDAPLRKVFQKFGVEVIEAGGGRGIWQPRC